MLNISEIQLAFNSELNAAKTEGDFDALRIKYLGRKQGILTAAFSELVAMPLEQKQNFGKELNGLRKYIETELGKQLNLQATNEQIDLTLPPLKRQIGHLHPMTQAEKELEEIFSSIGFTVEMLPEIESDWYNFESLNMPKLHPARDMQDTFYVNKASLNNPPKEDVVLRTHISTVQSRSLEKYKPPFAKISIGRVYRNEATDASHEHTYNEVEGIVVGPDVNFANMTWTLDFVLKKFFGHKIKTRLVPSYFPFTEPSAEMGISCLNCEGRGCPVCKHTGWVELLGCGMTHQKVYQNLGYKEGELQGFAFGMGSSRLALMKYRLPDIRLFSQNDLQFLNQF